MCIQPVHAYIMNFQTVLKHYSSNFKMYCIIFAIIALLILLAHERKLKFELVGKKLRDINTPVHSIQKPERNAHKSVVRDSKQQTGVSKGKQELQRL